MLGTLKTILLGERAYAESAADRRRVWSSRPIAAVPQKINAFDLENIRIKQSPAFPFLIDRQARIVGDSPVAAVVALGMTNDPWF